MAKKRELEGPTLFELPPPVPIEPKVRGIRYPVWTENKATLIQRYLLYFVYITKHGTYIDGFAGPQDPDRPEMWSARLVIESRPRWLRNFFLFELDHKKVLQLEEMIERQPPREKKEPKRKIEVTEGDFNQAVKGLLSSGKLRSKEATFCLLDQRTFECDWATVDALSKYKMASKTKIELFYFLPNWWLDRSISALKDNSVLERWWGRSDYPSLRKIGRDARKNLFVDRFKHELKYASVKAWPIRDRADEGNVMYYMIHATDHPEAPKLMDRAYRFATKPADSPEQIQLLLGRP